jgi:C-terminal processing protease CtpA/Prc
VIDNMSAARAVIMPGDKIMQIDGKSNEYTRWTSGR